MTRTMFAVALSLVISLGMAAGSAQAQKTKQKAGGDTIKVVCDTASIQDAHDQATGPRTIFIVGICEEDVSITKDDITLSGNPNGDPCNKASPGGTGTIQGTVTVDGVRASIEFLTITGDGAGVVVTNRADARLTCNEISDNQESGVIVERSSNTVLVDNTLSENGQRRINSPNVFFDSGLVAVGASSVFSVGNTYKDNQYAAIEIDRQSAFRNGAFLPRETGGGPADPNERDVITEKGCNPGTGDGCFTTDEGPVAIEVFNGGLVDLRNADVNGEIEASALSSFRIDGDGAIQGNILAQFGSVVRIRDRSLLGDRVVTFTGTLTCNDTSQTFFSNVQCGDTCSGGITATGPGGDTYTP